MTEDNKNIKLTYIGHGSCLIECGRQSFLTDPNFSERVMFEGKRLSPPGLSPKDLPSLAAILVSNACYDHLDVFSYKYFSTHTSLLAPKGVGQILQKFLPNPVTEISRWGHHSIFGHQIHALPVKKSSYRLFPFIQRGACAFLIESPLGNIYFTGDTAYGDHFKKAAQKFDIDIAILPLATKNNRISLTSKTLNPEEWLNAAHALKAKHAFPIRWGTFDVTSESKEEAIKQLKENASQHAYSGQIHFWQIGDQVDIALQHYETLVQKNG